MSNERLILKGLMAAIVLLNPQYSQAKLSERTYVATDDFTACRSHVQDHIRFIQRSAKDVHFNCYKGFVIELYAPSASNLLSQPAEAFVKEHWQLFLPAAPKEPLQFMTGNWLFGKTTRQVFKGFEIWLTGANKVSGVELRGVGPDYTLLNVQINDTSQWAFKPRVRLSRDQAVETARRYESSRQAKGKWKYRPEGRPSIRERFANEGLALAWPVEVRNETSYHVLLVDAYSGEVCNPQENKCW